MKASGLNELKISKEIIFHIIPWGPMKDKSVIFIHFLLVNYKPPLWMYIYMHKLRDHEKQRCVN